MTEFAAAKNGGYRSDISQFSKLRVSKDNENNGLHIERKYPRIFALDIIFSSKLTTFPLTVFNEPRKSVRCLEQVSLDKNIRAYFRALLWVIYNNLNKNKEVA